VGTQQAEAAWRYQSVGLIVILVISIVLQFAAAVWALRLVWVTGKRTAWVLIAAAILLMAIRRCDTLSQAVSLGALNVTSMSAELIALAISLLMLIGVVRIAPLFLSLKRSEEGLRRAYDELEVRNAQLKAENEARLRTEQSLKLEEARLEALLQLSQMSGASVEEMTRFTLERGIALSGSKIGFVGFLDEDEATYTLHAVSKDVVKECSVEGNPMHWPVIDAGIWSDAIRERRTLFVNDYTKPHPGKKGLPTGHPPVSRLMVVPLFDGKRIVAVAGVGNKASDYDRSDERQIALLLGRMWDNVQKNLSRKALKEAYDKLEQKVKQRTEELQEAYRDLNRAQSVANTGSWRLDIRSNQLLWSDETYRIFGISKGTPMTYETFLSSVHQDDREYVDQKWTAALRGEPYDIEHRIIAGDEVKWVREKAELELDSKGELKGGFGTVQNVSERKKAEEELTRLNRELRAISDCNQVIVRAEDRHTLFNDICRIMCEDVGYVMSWIGTVEHDAAKTVRPLAWYGDDTGYLTKANITWADTERGRGPTGIAARTGRIDFCQDFVNEPKAAPWRDEAVARGFRSSIAIPLFDNGGSVFAVFTLYASEPNGFTAQEVRLLEELAGDLSFGVRVLRTREERRKAEESLRETRDYLDNLINYANAPIIVWNPKLEITRFNHAFEELTGHKADEMLGEKVDILIPSDNRVATLKMITRTTRKGERWKAVEIPIQHVSGEVRIVLWNSATLFDVDGKTPLATIAQGQDITERKKVEQLKDEFVGLVSHELRTPLTVIGGSIRTAMSEGVSQEDGRELLQNAAEGVDSLAVILENMLELSRYQAGRLQLRVEMVRIADTVQTVIGKLKRHGISREFLIDIPEELPPVEADPVRVERILFNLMENATKYSPENSRITVSSRTQDAFVVTSVTDQGSGISPDDRVKIFEPFRRLETSQRQTKGIGLGLVVCKRIAEAQGGWIKVESELGKGSTFAFALPKHRMTQ
jgi:PAS domain S-box-containing protein